MRVVLYLLVQWTWGLIQTTAGFFMYCMHLRDRHYFYHGATVTEWNHPSGLSLGAYIFIPNHRYRDPKDRRLLVHEYGHTIQSLILGPLYLFVIGIPSFLWANLKTFQQRRVRLNTSYYAFYTERWANDWARKVTKEEPMI
ncbi:MAG: hypothetical protein J6D18_02030 [Erysipelotrichaceae bacterium]|nr:hypothetical protein [Erysipelotrichaceae bacterium]